MEMNYKALGIKRLQNFNIVYIEKTFNKEPSYRTKLKIFYVIKLN